MPGGLPVSKSPADVGVPSPQSIVALSNVQSWRFTTRFVNEEPSVAVMSTPLVAADASPGEERDMTRGSASDSPTAYNRGRARMPTNANTPSQASRLLPKRG